jgi:hypothetical protein
MSDLRAVLAEIASQNAERWVDPLSLYSQDELDICGERFLKLIVEQPGITAQRLSEITRVPLWGVEKAIEIACAVDLVVVFEGPRKDPFFVTPADVHCFAATTAEQRERHIRIMRLWNEAVRLTKFKQ